MASSKVKTDPYQWFFPLAVLAGMIGTGLWGFFKLGVYPYYPGLNHAELMIGGFFLLTAVGFLMTAVPRFTNTHSATRLEILLSFLTALPLIPSALLPERLLFHTLTTLTLLLVVRFGLSRLRKAKLNPPPSFILVAFGLVEGIAGSLILTINDLTPLPAALSFFGRQLFLYGLFYGPALGIGTQLLPNLMGTSLASKPIPLSSTPMHARPEQAKRQKIFAVFGIILFLSFVLEAWGSLQAGRILRALVTSILVFGFWRLHTRPNPGILVRFLWVSAWMLALGGWPAALLNPAYAVHGTHVLFIGSLSVMIFGVATRVVLAHGGHGQNLERNSKILWGVLILLIFSLLTRLFAPVFPALYFSHLAYAGLLWVLGALLWLGLFFPKIIRRKTGS